MREIDYERYKKKDGTFDEKSYRVDNTRCHWGNVFSECRTAREYMNSAWYCVEDKRAWMQEEKQRIYGLREYLQKQEEDLDWRIQSLVPREDA